MAQIRDAYDADDAANSLSFHIMAWLQEIRVEELFVTCLSCKHLGDQAGTCNKFPGHLIPPHVVIKGCDAYEDVMPRRKPLPRGNGASHLDDDIPF